MKTALILPGGGTRGAFEVGACKEIIKKIVPDLIIGTSVGAVNGVVLANGKDPITQVHLLEKIWRNASRRTFFPYNPRLFFNYHLAKSIYTHNGLYRQLRKNITVKHFEELDIELHVNCTNMNTGESEFFKQGALFDPIVASCSLPPFFAPLTINKVPYIDGSIGSFFGIKDAKCQRIIIVDLMQTKYSTKRKNLGVFAARTSSILISKLITDEIELAKGFSNIMHIKADFKDVHFTDFAHTDELIQLGQKAARKVLG